MSTRLERFREHLLSEMKVIKGPQHNYFQVARWSELASVFARLPALDKQAARQRMEIMGKDASFQVLRGILHNGKLYVWDGWHGNLHDDGALDIGLREVDSSPTDADIYLDLGPDLLEITSASSTQPQPRHPVLDKVLKGCPVKVEYK